MERLKKKKAHYIFITTRKAITDITKNVVAHSQILFLSFCLRVFIKRIFQLQRQLQRQLQYHTPKTPNGGFGYNHLYYLKIACYKSTRFNLK